MDRRTSQPVKYLSGYIVPGGDTTKVDPNVATFARNASRMSDLTDMAPTKGTDFALTLC